MAAPDVFLCTVATCSCSQPQFPHKKHNDGSTGCGNKTYLSNKSKLELLLHSICSTLIINKFQTP